MPAKAIVLGSSGLVGSLLVDQLAADPAFDEVVLLVRRQLHVNHSKIRQRIINFDELDQYRDELNGHVIFSCLGTTKSEVADYKEYRKIDVVYPVQIAEAAAANGVEQFHVVSSIGANKNASAEYLKLKGELEDDLKQIRFKSLHIYRPSFISGERARPRITDKIITPIMRIINPLLHGGLKKYRSIDAAVIAHAMISQAKADLTGLHIYESDQIQDIK